ncbi:hypothetical protein LIER_19583 [Lithospermum erythrorhizon]|uniref:Reverse transcriptase n=1 Tax=Lithospermum erythrorhizon TaxID=34254 RepID=A0AAV3QM28_LITER
MEAFNSLLLMNMRKYGYDFHPSCDKLKLTHEFGDKAGLYPNLDKSLCFFSGVSNETEIRLGRILSIPVGTFPVKYLGVSLTTAVLTTSDCRFFMDKVKNSIDVWSHKNISFAGRVVLINSVLFGAFNY